MGVSLGGRRDPTGQVAYLFGSNVADRCLALVASVVIARYLGAAELGRVGPALVLGALVARLGDFGVSITLQRDVARDREHASRLLAEGLGFRAVSSAAGLGLLLFYVWGTTGITFDAWLPLLAGGAAIASGWFQMFAAVWMGTLRSEFVAASQAAYRLLHLALIGVVIVLGQGSTAIMFALLIAAAVQVLIAVRITERSFFRPALAVDGRRMLALLRDSWPIGVASFTVMAYDRIDTLVASWMLAPVAVGNYVAAYALYAASLTASNAVGSVSFSVFSRDSSDPALLLARYRRTTLMLAAIGTAIGGCFFLGAGPAISFVYGAKYQTAGACLRVLAFAVAVLFINNLGGVTLNAIGCQRLTLVLTVGALVLNVGLNLLFVPAYGILAAAWVTVATEAVVAIAAVCAVETVLRKRISLPVAMAGEPA